MNTLVTDLTAVIKFSFLPMILLSLALTLFVGSELFFPIATFLLLIFLYAELPVKAFDDWNYGHSVFFQTQLVVAVTVIILCLALFVWYWLAPAVDFLGLAALGESWWGLDPMRAREAAPASKTVITGILAGLCSAALSAVYGHELIHKPIGSALHRMGVLAHIITFFSYFSVSHPLGHHHLMATKEDHATPRRGENLYQFAWRSRIGKQKQTWALEKNRLAKLSVPVWHWKNRALRYWLLEALLAFSLISFAGWQAVSILILIGLTANFFMEIANYVQHYGLLRAPQKPIESRHIWSANHTLMNYMFAGAGRHAAHHVTTEHFWRYPGGSDKDPQMAAGLLLTALLSLFPPLFKYVMNRKLTHWDWEFASAEERHLAISASRSSGDKILMAHADELESSAIATDVQVA